MAYYCNKEDEVYYYHGDLCGSRAQSQACLSYAEMQQSVRSKHLGSASWITDVSGHPVQHLQYLPYGENYINQRAAGTTYKERYTFTGKEKDEETGYGYFGARYMDHELMTSWLSVDPMADKYPSISPYAYCAWNPVKLVDPDGMEWDPASVDRIAEFRATTEQKKKDALTESEKNEFQKVLDELDALGRSNQVYHLEIGGTENSKRPGGTSYNLAKKWVSLNYDGTDKCLAHELKHAYQFEKGELSFSSKTGSLADVVT